MVGGGSGHAPVCVVLLTPFERSALESVARLCGSSDAAGEIEVLAYKVMRGHVRNSKAFGPLVPAGAQDASASCGECVVLRAAPDGRPPCEISDPLRLHDGVRDRLVASFIERSRGFIVNVLRDALRRGHFTDELIRDVAAHAAACLRAFDPDRGISAGAFLRPVITRAAWRLDSRERRWRAALTHEGEVPERSSVEPPDVEVASELLLDEAAAAVQPLLDRNFRRNRIDVRDFIDLTEEGNAELAVATGYSERSMTLKRKSFRAGVLRKGLRAQWLGTSEAK